MSAKQLFSDIAKEMESRCISDIYEVQGHKYEMRLLNGEEAQWRNAHIMLEGLAVKGDGKVGLSSANLAALTSIKLPTLAMGIRKIDSESVEEAFEEDWGSVPAKQQLEMLKENKYAKKWFIAEHFMQYLANWSDAILEDLWNNWAALEERRRQAGEELKKSSGEALEKKEKPNLTELSPSGEVL